MEPLVTRVLDDEGNWRGYWYVTGTDHQVKADDENGAIAEAELLLETDQLKTDKSSKRSVESDDIDNGKKKHR